jgi:hypothetical protein
MKVKGNIVKKSERREKEKIKECENREKIRNVKKMSVVR